MAFEQAMVMTQNGQQRKDPFLRRWILARCQSCTGRPCSLPVHAVRAHRSSAPEMIGSLYLPDRARVSHHFADNEDGMLRCCTTCLW